MVEFWYDIGRRKSKLFGGKTIGVVLAMSTEMQFF